MKYRVSVTIFAIMLSTVAVFASDFGVHAGYYGSDLKEAFVGADLMLPIGPAALVPNIDYSRKSGIGYWFGSVDLDLRYASSGASYWFGAGPTYAYFTGYGGEASEYGGSGNTYKEWGWDVNGGLGWRMGGLKPYATVRYLKIHEFRSTGAAIGLRF